MTWFKLSLFISLFLFSLSSINAQKSYITASGQSIYIYPNGNWKYADFKSNNSGESLFTDNNANINPYELPQDQKYTLSGGEENMLRELRTQLLFVEVDYFVKHTIIKNRIDSGANDDTDKSLEKDLKSKYNKATNLLKLTKKIPNEDLEKRSKLFFTLKKEIATHFGINTSIENSINSKMKKASFEIYSFEIDERNSRTLDNNDDCTVIFDGFDVEINQKRKETKGGKLFGYTHSKLMTHFKTNDFLTGEVSMMLIGKKIYLNLKVILATKDAKRSYGSIQEASMLRLKLINGKNIFLKNQIHSEGVIQAYTGNTIYQALYKIENEDLSQLKNVELDRVGLMWSSGFEEYEIYKVDYIQNQLACLKNDK